MLIKLFLLYIAVINTVAFCLMGYDKHQAKKHHWRVSEKTLMLSAIALGAFGAWAGMYTFRHKTKHKKFVIGVPICLVLNVTVIIYCFTYFFN